jgi:hypothetical protein
MTAIRLAGTTNELAKGKYRADATSLVALAIQPN